MNFGMGQYYRFQHEFCIYAHRGKALLNNAGQQSDVWQIERDNKIVYSHPTQKPVSLMIRCIEDSSVSGDLILDPFLGSGTTLVAARQLGRRGIGIEIDRKYCEIAEKRIHLARPRLFQEV